MSHLYMKGLMLRTSIALVAVFGSLAVAAESAVQSLEYQSYVLTPTEGLPNGLTGRLKSSGRSTRGNYSVVVRESQTSQAADAHTHSQLVEAWYVVEGTMTFQSREGAIDAPAGTFVLVPPGVEHGFKITAGKTVRLVQIFSPPGFENLFSERLKLPSYDPGKEIGQQSAQWKADQKDIARKYGAGPADPPTQGQPLVRVPTPGLDRRVLATAEESAGRYTLEELTFAPGKAPSALPKVRENDQAWYLLSGELRVAFNTTEGRQEKILTSGDFVFLPRDTAFSASNPARQPARLLLWQSKPRDLKAD